MKQGWRNLAAVVSRGLLCLLASSAAAQTVETYRFERMWPRRYNLSKLRQS